VPTCWFCRDASTVPRSGMHERRVVDVLADVVLVEPHGRIRREREILQATQVDRTGSAPASRRARARTTAGAPARAQRTR